MMPVMVNGMTGKTGNVVFGALLFWLMLWSVVAGEAGAAQAMRWEGWITVTQAVVVPRGFTLTVAPGTVVRFAGGDGVGLTIQGRLRVLGRSDSPVLFFAKSVAADKEAGWAGIRVDGGEAFLVHAGIRQAATGVRVRGGVVRLKHSVVARCDTGIVGNHGASVTIAASMIAANNRPLAMDASRLEMVDSRVIKNRGGLALDNTQAVLRDVVLLDNDDTAVVGHGGQFILHGGYLAGNSGGVVLADSQQVLLEDSIVVGNGQVGVSLERCGKGKVAANFFQGHSGTALILRQSALELVGNQFSANGRPLSVHGGRGRISGNSFLGRENITVNGADQFDISGNFNAVGDGQPRVRPSPFVWPSPLILSDTAWAGEIIVPQRIEGAAGAVLAIRPGTTVRVAPGRGMWANCEIRAVGERFRPIRFTALEPGKPWHQIMVENSAAIFRYCIFEGAETGLHSHFSQLEVTACIFRHNRSGMMFQGGPVRVRYSRFTENAYGITPNRAVGEVFFSEISGNRIGVMVKNERGMGMAIHHNNIHHNQRYNVKMGDLNYQQDVDVRYNWWGGGDPVATFYDDRSEPGVGRARYLPVAKVFRKLPVPAVEQGECSPEP